MDKTNISLYSTGEKNEYTLTAGIENNTESLRPENIIWTSSNDNIALVDKGRVIGKSEGEAVITASLGGKTAKCIVTVKNHEIKLNKASAIMYVTGDGKSTTLKASIDGVSVAGSRLGWKTSSSDIAIVSNGTVAARNPGTVTITATDGKAEASCIITVKTLPAPSAKAISAGYNKIKVSWSGVSGAGGYKIYRATSRTGKYYLQKTLTSGYRSWYDTGRTTGKTYYYKVRAYYKKSQYLTYYGDYSTVRYAKPELSKPGTPRISRYSKSYVKVKWSGISGESGYQVYRARSLKGTYSKVKSVKMTTYSYPYAKIKTTRNRTYYYKVRSYKYVNGKIVYGPFSYVKSYKLR